MYHRLRTLHRWIGLVSSFFLMTLAVTGFLLATKKTTGWVRPPERDGAKIESLAEVISVHDATSAAFTLGIPELKAKRDIDRVDYRPKSNVFKIVSKEGYHEVQVCGKTGEVLQVAHRIDQFVEDIHDLSLFADSMNGYFLPVIGIGLFTLGASGVVIFFVPVARRIKARKKLVGRSVNP
jgi:uncharacterized iron-regulated membrane protein